LAKGNPDLQPQILGCSSIHDQRFGLDRRGVNREVDRRTAEILVCQRNILAPNDSNALPL
jgi:hypothetical protein